MLKVGTDIVEVARLKSSIHSYGGKFLNKIFSENEVRYCESKAFPEQHYAGKFAAKESIQKALMAARPELNFPLPKIEINNDANGRPFVKLLDSLNVIHDQYQIEISISHVKDYATAIAVVSG